MTRMKLLYLLIATGIITSVNAQQNKDVVLSAVRELQETYSKTKMLSTGIRYYYANETKPNIILDSLKGAIILNGSSYLLQLDSTEIMVNGKYSISLYKEDKLIYLNLPPSNAVTYNPVASLDTLFTQVEGVRGDVKEDGQYKTVAIVFPQGMPYKQILMVIDKRTGYLNKITMVLKTTFMTPSMSEADLKREGYDTYALITTIYTNYQQVQLPEDYFNERRFFYKDGNDYRVTEQYKDYKIFLGSPNL